jgi:hypothetical protein
MTTAPVDVSLSHLLNKPTATLSLLEFSRRVLLRRREAEDLILTTASRAAEDDEVVSTTSRLFTEILRRDPAVLTMTVEVLPAVFPWIQHLPDDAKEEFAEEWLDALSTAAALGSFAEVVGLVASWRSTAGVYADPERSATSAELHDDGTDYGPVPLPVVPE